MVNTPSTSGGNSTWKPLLVFFLFTLAIAVVGYAVFHRYKKAMEADAQDDLNAISTLKTGQISLWMAERKADATTLMENSFFLGEANRWLLQGERDDETRAKLIVRLTSAQRNYAFVGYSTFSLFDAKGVQRLSTHGIDVSAHAHEQAEVLESMRAGRIIFSDIHQFNRGGKEMTEIDLVAPLFAGKGSGAHAIGAVVWHIDPAVFLFPLIQSWPTHSASAENMLVRREGDEVVFMNKLRHLENAPLVRHFPLSQNKLLASKAVMGQEGLAEGVDYRGVPVVGVLNRVPGTSWFMVSKVDRAEIDAPINRLARWMLALMLALVSTGGTVVYFWQRNNKKYFEIELGRQVLSKRLDYLAKNANDIILLLDGSANIIDFNNRALEAYGYTAAEFTGINLAVLRAIDFTPPLEDKIDEIVNAEALRFESVHVRKNGANFPVENSVRAIDIGGEKVYQAIIRDISERKRTEEALHRSETLFRTLYDSTRDAVMLVKKEGFLDCNKATLTMFGCATLEEFCAISLADISPPYQPDGGDSRTLAEQNNVSAMANGSHQFEWQCRRLDNGMEFSVEVLLNRMELDGRTVLQARVRDINDLKRRELELQKFEAIIDSTDDAIISKSMDGIIQSWNPGAEKIFGYAAHEVLGKPIALLLPADRADEEAEILASTAHGERKKHYETVRLRKDGSKIDVSVTISPIYGSQGRVLAASTILRDITERIRVTQLMSFISQRNWHSLRHDFLPALAQQLAQLASVDYAIIGKISKNGTMTQTVGLCAHGSIIPNISYALAGTPCENVIGQKMCLYPDNIQQCFPSDTMLVEMKAQSYLGVPLWDSTGQAIGLIAILDGKVLGAPGLAVTLLTQAATSAGAELERLREESSLRKLSMAVEQSPSSVIITDRDANIEYVNQAFVRESGYGLDEVIGQNPRILTAGKTPKATYREMWTSLKRGEIWQGELINRCKDGSEYISFSLISPVRDENGRISNYLSLRENVTEHKKNLAEIKRLSRAYRLLSRVNEMIVRVKDRYLLFNALCNAAVESMLFRFAWIGLLDEQRSSVIPVAYAGVEEGYITKLNIRIDDEHTGNGPTGRAIRTGIPTSCQDIQNDSCMSPWREEAIKRGYYSSAVFPIYESGTVVGAITVYAGEIHFFTPEIAELMQELAANLSFALDVMAERARRELAEAEINKLNVELEQRVMERTRQLEAANQELESFSYSVSHDLRAPLRSIDGFSQILLKKYQSQLDPSGQDYLSRVRNASQRMGKLIDDLLQLSRVTRGELKYSQVDLSHMVATILRELSTANPQRAVQVTLQHGLTVSADAGLLRIAMDNLLGNAWKYSGRKMQAVIEFGACASTEGQVFFVRDNGEGFCMEHAHKLFGAFQRLHSAQEFEGTGIGLVTVRRIIRRHQGEIWVEAKPGEGATFYFTLPFEKCKDA